MVGIITVAEYVERKQPGIYSILRDLAGVPTCYSARELWIKLLPFTAWKRLMETPPGFDRPRRTWAE